MTAQPRARKALQQRFARVQLTPLEQARSRAMYAVCNSLRTTMRKLWQSQAYKRGGKHLHRKAIARGVRVKVKRFGADFVGAVGISQKVKYAKIVNVLDPGFRNILAQKSIEGRHVRARTLQRAGDVAKKYGSLVHQSLYSMLNGGTGKVTAT